MVGMPRMAVLSSMSFAVDMTSGMPTARPLKLSWISHTSRIHLSVATRGIRILFGVRYLRKNTTAILMGVYYGELHALANS